MADFEGAPIGFIGLGIMGKPMARNLAKAGYDLVVYNRSRDDVDTLLAEGDQFRRRQARARWPSGPKLSSPCFPIHPMCATSSSAKTGCCRRWASGHCSST